MCRESVLSLNMPEAPLTQAFKDPLYSSRDLSLISGKNILYKEDMYAVSPAWLLLWCWLYLEVMLWNRERRIGCKEM